MPNPIPFLFDAIDHVNATLPPDGQFFLRKIQDDPLP
jgi:hypothetical protein